MKISPWTVFATLALMGSALSVAAPARAQGVQQTAGARALAKQGFEAFQAKDYEKALDLFAKAEEIHHATTHVLFMARSHRELGRPVEAYELYNKIIHEQLDPKGPKAFVEAQQSARTEGPEVEALISYVTVRVSGPLAEEAELIIDGQPLPPGLLGIETPVNPGRREFSAKSAEGQAEPVTAEMESGGHHVVELTLIAGAAPVSGDEAEPASDGNEKSGPSRVPAYVALGVGGVGVILGTVFTIQHFGKKGKAEELFEEYGCDVACSAAEEEDVNNKDKQAATAGTVGIISYGVGVAGLVTGVTLLLLSPKKDKAESATLPSRGAPSKEPTVRPFFGWQYAGVTGTF